MEGLKQVKWKDSFVSNLVYLKAYLFRQLSSCYLLFVYINHSNTPNILEKMSDRHILIYFTHIQVTIISRITDGFE